MWEEVVSRTDGVLAISPPYAEFWSLMKVSLEELRDRMEVDDDNYS